jgi:hypothetical protein
MAADPPPFAPPPGLRNAHLQSVLASLPPRRWFVAHRARALVAASEDVLVDCGDGVRLLGHHAAHPGGRGELVLMLHGWEGSAESNYVLSSAAHLWALGFDVFRLNLRDHGPTHHLNPELFHSCRIAEVVGAVKSVQARHAAQRLTLVGYSLGGNFALRVAVRAPAAGILLRQVIAVCPVLDPAHTLDRLERGAWIYRNYFVRKWRSSLLKKHRAWPDLYDIDELLARHDLTSMTERLVLRYSSFPDLMSYLTGYAIVGAALADLRVPSRIIMALDDPIVPASDLSRLATPPSLAITTTARGGHCAFLDSLVRESWADRLIAAILCGP